MENYEVVLEHHGVKGMKWGVRRYQNKDGSLTPRGKRRLGIGESISGYFKKRKAESVKKKAAAEKAKAAEEKKKTERDVESKKEEILKSRSPKAVYENAHLFTDNELRSIKTRFDLEKNIRDLYPADLSKGEKFVKNTDKFSSVVESGGKAYNNVARIYNAFFGNANNMPLPTIDFNNQVKMKTAEERAKDLANKEKTLAEANKAKAEADRLNREAGDINAANAKAKQDKAKASKDAANQAKSEKQAAKEQAKVEKQADKEARQEAKSEAKARKEVREAEQQAYKQAKGSKDDTNPDPVTSLATVFPSFSKQRVSDIPSSDTSSGRSEVERYSAYRVYTDPLTGRTTIDVTPDD